MTGVDVLDLSVSRVREILERGYGLAVDDVAVVSGEVATVCRVTTHEGTYAFKAMPVSGDGAEALDWQTRVMTELRGLGLPVAPVVPDADGRLLHAYDVGGRHVLVQVSGWLSDPPLSDVLVDAPLLRAVGDMAARVSLALDGREPPVVTGHPWELVRTARTIRSVVGLIHDEDVTALVERAVRIFDELVAPALPDLPWTVVHHDLHDSNLLVGRDAGGRRAVTGILDFGDLVRGPRLAELAVAAAYAARNTDDPRAALLHVAAGWSAVRPLTDAESACLLPAAVSRLATNVAVWASRTRGPRASYATARMTGTHEALETLMTIGPAGFAEDLREGATRAAS